MTPLTSGVRRAGAVASGSGPPGRLAVVPSRKPVDRDRAERAMADLLEALGADLAEEGLRRTPQRGTDAFLAFLTPRPFESTTFPNDDGYDQLIIARDIQFSS